MKRAPNTHSNLVNKLDWFACHETNFPNTCLNSANVPSRSHFSHGPLVSIQPASQFDPQFPQSQQGNNLCCLFSYSPFSEINTYLIFLTCLSKISQISDFLYFFFQKRQMSLYALNYLLFKLFFEMRLLFFHCFGQYVSTLCQFL